MEWQPIETAPKDGTEIIIYCHWIGKSRIAWFKKRYTGNYWVISWGTSFKAKQNMITEIPIERGEPSHWMPLPQPPGDTP